MMFDRHAKLALIVVCMVLIGSGIGFRVAVAALNITLNKKPVPLRDHFASLPQQLGDWSVAAEDRVLGEAVIESLGTSDYLNRFFARETDAGMQYIDLHLAYYTGEIDGVPHVPDRCFVASGGLVTEQLATNVPLSVDTSRWRANPTVTDAAGEPYRELTFAHHVSARPVTVHLPRGDFVLRTSSFRDQLNPDRRIWAGYFFIANGKLTPTPAGVRTLAFDPTEEYAYYCKVQFTMIADEDTQRDAFIAAASDLCEQALPQIMRCLPDWPEVEALQEYSDTETQASNASADSDHAS